MQTQEPWTVPPKPPRTASSGKATHTVDVDGVEFGIVVAVSEGRHVATVPGTNILVDEADLSTALDAVAAEIALLAQELRDGLESPTTEADADGAADAEEEEIAIPDEAEGGVRRTNGDGAEALIDTRRAPQLDLVVPTLKEALDALHVAETKLTKTTATETKAKENKKSAQTVYDQARVAVIAAAEREVTPGLSLREDES